MHTVTLSKESCARPGAGLDKQPIPVLWYSGSCHHAQGVSGVLALEVELQTPSFLPVLTLPSPRSRHAWGCGSEVLGG